MHIIFQRKLIYIPYSVLALLLISAASQAPLQSQETQRNNERNNEQKNPVIIVKGKSLRQTLADLESCLARNCPPNEDIDATLAHAENLFVEGDYNESTKIINQSIKRNKKFSSEYPFEVADLYHSNGNVLQHLGDVQKSTHAMIKMRDILAENVPDDIRSILTAELSVASARLKGDSRTDAKRIYRRIYQEAIRNNLPDLANFARLSELNIDIGNAIGNDNQKIKKDVRDKINEYIADIGDPTNNFSIAMEILLARVNLSLHQDDNDGDLAAEDNISEDLIKSYARSLSSNRPILISSDPLNLSDILQELVNENALTFDKNTGLPNNEATDDFTDRWADLGFYITPDGKVEDVEVLRLEGRDTWLNPIKKSILSRVYAPIFNPNTNETDGQYIVERYTYTSNSSNLETRGGSFIRRRSSVPIVRRLDLTEYPDFETKDDSKNLPIQG